MAKWLYVFQDPFGVDDCKIGITSNPKVRLAAYQSGYSTKSHKARFDYVWEGPPSQIDRLESVLKERYDWDIDSKDAGQSEWITGVTPESLIPIINEVIDGWKFHIKPVEMDLPITTDDIEWGTRI
jgi:hypothetical protein